MHELRKLRDEVKAGTKPVSHLIAVFDVLLEELISLKGESVVRTSQDQLELFFPQPELKR